MSPQVTTGSQRLAGLDLGTNTFLCLIADVDKASGALKVVRDEVRIVRLGQGVDASKTLHPEALARAEACFKEFESFILEAKAEKILAVATSATRDSSNGHLLIELGRKHGIPIEVISGEREAELTFQGSLEPHWQGLTAVIDVGGGSTEVIIGDQSGIVLRFSADVGSVRLTEKYVTSHPIAKTELQEMEYLVRRRLHEGLQKSLAQFGDQAQASAAWSSLRTKLKNVVAVAGTPTTLAAVVLGKPFEAEAIHGFSLSMKTLEDMTVDLASKTVERRQAMGGMEPKRADVIVAGAICLKEAGRLLGAEALEVSIRGLRYGVVKGLV